MHRTEVDVEVEVEAEVVVLSLPRSTIPCRDRRAIQPLCSTTGVVTMHRQCHAGVTRRRETHTLSTECTRVHPARPAPRHIATSGGSHQYACGAQRVRGMLVGGVVGEYAREHTTIVLEVCPRLPVTASVPPRTSVTTR